MPLLVNQDSWIMRELQLYPGNRTVSQKALTVIEGMQLLVELYSENMRFAFEMTWIRGIREDCIQILNASPFGQNQQFPEVGANQKLHHSPHGFRGRIDDPERAPHAKFVL